MESYKEIWSHTLSYIKEKADFTPATYSIWFKDLELESMTSTTLYLSAKELYRAEFVFNMCYDKLENAVYQTLARKGNIVIFSRDVHGAKIQDYIKEHIAHGTLPEKAFSKELVSKTYSDELPLSEDEKLMVGEPKGALITTEIPPTTAPSGIVEEYTFDNFIVGETNKLAYNACYAVATNPASSFNPLLIWSPSGMGKTHLLYAISNEIVKKNKGKRVLYVKGSDFANNLIDSLLVSKKPMHYFREKYRNIDVLLVDDIQFIAGKESTQEEFFHTFNALYEQNKQIILASDRPPRDMKNLEERLRSRFEQGLIIDIQPPELELRMAIIKSKMTKYGVDIPNDVIFYISENIKSNVRQLEGVIKKLNSYSLLFNEKIDLRLAEKCMEDIIPKESVDNTVKKIFSCISDQYGVTEEELISTKRNANIVIARHVATYILRHITPLSSIEIARYFSQNHTSVLSAEKNVEKKMEEDAEFEKEIESLIKRIKET